MKYHTHFFAVALCVSTLIAFNTYGQIDPEDSLKSMTVADGLEVTLFAAEPQLRNPTSMDIDAQGRVWVTEAVNYRLFNQSVADDQGDRIRVLEDTDGDGRCDKAWTFYQDKSLQSPMGIAVLGDRVYVCQSPDLFYLRDTDGDGVADERTVVLTGFGGIDHDHAIHGVMFGADGHLYMSNGDRGLDVTDKLGNRIHAGRNGAFQAATVLRTDLDGVHLELLSSNMRNPYEPTVNSYGTVFISDNDDDGNQQTRINYVMDGGNYGYWPGRKGNKKLDAIHWNEDRAGTVPKMIKTGFGSPTGILFYEGDLLPKRFHRTLIHSDAGPGEIRSYRPLVKGAGYSAEAEVILSSKTDKWFRPSDVCVAPDGSVLVADWYDAGVGGHRMVDTVGGRIYRLAPKGNTYTSPPLDLDSQDGLEAALASPNQARRFFAHTSLEENAAKGDTALLQKFFTGDDPVTRSRALWLLAENEDVGARAIREAASHSDVDLRIQAVRILGRRDIDAKNGFNLLASGTEHDDAFGNVMETLLRDPAPGVRRQLLLELGKAADREWVQEWLDVLIDAYDGEDRFYREAIGIAMQGNEATAFESLIARKENARWDTATAGLAFQLHPSEALQPALENLHDNKVPLEARISALEAVDAIGTPQAGLELISTINGELPIPIRQHALYLLSRNEGDSWREAFAQADIDAQLRRAIEVEFMEEPAFSFIRETRRTSFLPYFVAIARDDGSSEETRRESLETVRRMASRVRPSESAESLSLLEPLLNASEEGVQLATVRAIRAFRHDDALQLLRGVLTDPDQSRPIRREVVRLLAGSHSGSVVLIDLAEQDEVASDLTLAFTETLHGSRYEDIRFMATQAIPRERAKGGDELPSLEKLIGMNGNSVRGKTIFFDAEKSQCYTCHAIAGEGKNVGPDLSKIGEKLSRQGLYESILNPSAAIAHEYKVWMVRTENRGYLSGYIRSESDTSLELMDSSGESSRIAKTAIIEQWESELSLMPTGLSAGLTTEELVDLVAYLSTLK